MWLALLAALGLGQSEPPTDHTVIYYNARMALREGEPLEATKLWLLRNALRDQSGRVSPHDPDFHSVTWAALGELGICQDGHPTDDDGAGLWPLALHNWVVQNRGRKTKGNKPKPFDGFELGQQQRFVSISDVLSAKEMQTVRLFRSACLRPRLVLINAGESITADLADRQVTARMLQYLLERAKQTLAEDNVRGKAAIDARLFDIYLQRTALAEREARQKAAEAARAGREIRMSRPAIEAMNDQADAYTFRDDSKPAQILREAVDWPISEWIALEPERRLFLYEHAKAYGGESPELDRVALGVLDHLIATGDGKEAERWIAHRSEDPGEQDVIWSGERGQELLALDRESGFQERGVIALHRGVNLLERGDLPGAMRAMAYALQYANESRSADTLQSLSLRWLTYIASQFEITDELLITLQELVPRREYSVMLEDLMWGAALRADRISFERGERNQVGRGALERRMSLLRPLADGNVGGFTGRIRSGLDSSPSETMRFVDQMVERLELEDVGVRTAHVPTLVRVRQLLEPFAADIDGRGRQARTAQELMDRSQAILEGLDALGADASTRDRARSLDPSSEVFAGSVRLAPSDALPWPFRAGDVPAPSVFTPLQLTPEEWRQDDELVFGWSIEG